jgi:hypothetical protein
MSRILFAWELGAGAGHVASFLPCALLLQERGHEVVFAVRDLPRTEIALGGHPFPILQSPIFVRDNITLPPAVSYPELLLRFGYGDASDLRGMARGWLGLFETVRPDLVVVDHGPTALLAARIADLRRSAIGTGFSLPPRIDPMPSFRPWLDVPHDRLVTSERHVVDAVNQVVLGLGGRTPLGVLADLFDVAESFLCTVPELDHYDRTDGTYWGPTVDRRVGDEPEWPAATGPRIFVYLPGTYGGLDRLLHDLRSIRASKLLYLPGRQPGKKAVSSDASMRISPNPVRMERVLEQCDLVVCHAGHGTVAAALLAGRPLLLIPDHVEQLLLARKVVALGVAKMVNPDSRPSFGRLIGDILQHTEFAAAAHEFARKYEHFAGVTPQRAIAARCEELMATPAR